MQKTSNHKGFTYTIVHMRIAGVPAKMILTKQGGLIKATDIQRSGNFRASETLAEVVADFTSYFNHNK